MQRKTLAVKRWQDLLAILLVGMAALGVPLRSLPAAEAGAAQAIGLKRLTLVDESRPIKAAFGFPGSAQRRLDILVWYPAAGRDAAVEENAAADARAPWPLVIYSHGTLALPTTPRISPTSWCGMGTSSRHRPIR